MTSLHCWFAIVNPQTNGMGRVSRKEFCLNGSRRSIIIVDRMSIDAEGKSTDLAEGYSL